jgi:outer membrane protein assembly factor BamB
LFVGLSAIVLLSCGVEAADWPHWRGPDYNGISKETGFDPAALNDFKKPVWEAEIGVGFSSVTISSGKAYAMGNVDKKTDVVFCFDADTGKEIWRHSYPESLNPKYYEGGSSATPTVAGGKVYTISKSGKIFCLDANTGDVVWEKKAEAKPPTWGFSGSAVIQGDMVIFNVGDAGLALNKEDGSVVWKSGGGVSGYASAVPFTRDGKKCLALFGSKHLFGLEAATGKELWKAEWETKHAVNASDPIIVGDYVFVASGYNRGCGLFKIEGSSTKKIYDNKNMRSQLSGPVLIDGYLYGIDENQLVCLEMMTGEVKWKERKIGKGSLMAADGKLIVLSDKGTLYIAPISPKGFVPISSAKILSGKCWTMPVLANGKIYSKSAKGHLVCIDISGKSAMASLPTSTPPEANPMQEQARQWFQSLTTEQKARLRQKMQNQSEEEKRIWVEMRAKWQTASEAEKKKIRAEWQKNFDKLRREVEAGDSDSNDWPQFRGPNRDGKSGETGLLKKWPEQGPKMLWSVEGLGSGYSTVAIAGGTIYTTGLVDRKGVLFAFDMQGKEKWKKTYGAEWRKSMPGVRCTPTVDGGNVYVISGVGEVFCYDAKSGDQKWTVDAFNKFGGKYGIWGIAESPLIDGDNIICTPGGSKATMVALNKNTGETVWTCLVEGERSCYCSPILVERGPNKIIVTMTDDLVLGVDAKTGKLLWKDSQKDQFGENKAINPVSPIHHDGMVYATSGYDDGGAMLALSADGTSITRKWIDETLDCHHGGIVVVDGHIYGANWANNGDGSWVCLDWKTGKVKYETHWNCKGAVTYADGMLYCYEEKKGNVALVKPTPEKFDVVSSFKIELGDGKHWAHPVVCGKRLYIRHGDVLMAYDISAG